MTTSTAPLRQLNQRFAKQPIRALRQQDTGHTYFVAGDVSAFLCDTSYQTGRRYWHTQKSRDTYFDSSTYVNTQLNLPAANGRFHLTDVVDMQGLLHLIANIKHKGAQLIRDFVAQMGVLWLISLIRQAGQPLLQGIIDYAKARGKQIVLARTWVSHEFAVEADIRLQEAA